MFQPQATPYASSFSTYGVGSSVGDYPGIFQPTTVGGGGGGVVVDSGGPTVFENPIFSSNLGGALSFSTNTTSSTYDTRRPRNNNMSEHDLQSQERAAQKYEQEYRIEGPMVGGKKSSHAITEEYAKADPIYVTKTVALPQTYSHYRPIAGDGNCGWRAAGYCYFEQLLQSQSRSQIEEEIARITSLNNILVTAGGLEQWIAEDLTEETTTLLKELADAVEDSLDSAADILHARFNDENISLSIIYHLRLLASSWLALNPSEYMGFIPDGLGVLGYRKNCLEATNTEIEHLGMTLLIDVLLKPIGIAVEIVILDRSEGKQVNSHIFQSEDSNGLPTNPGGPMIHLLYRPSHYDILYKDQASIANHQAIAEMSHPSNVQVNRAHNFTQDHHIQSSTNMADFSQLDLNSPLLDLPGYSLVHQPSPHTFQAQYQAPLDQGYSHSPISSSLSPISNASMASPSAAMSATYSQPPLAHSQTVMAPSGLRSGHSGQAYLPANGQHHLHQQHLPTTTPLTHRPAPHTTHHTIPIELASPVSTASNFRPSQYNYNAPAEWHEPVVCQTSTFKNSHFNTAHYLNPDFQPEEWTPESEEPAPNGRKKSS